MSSNSPIKGGVLPAQVRVDADKRQWGTSTDKLSAIKDFINYKMPTTNEKDHNYPIVRSFPHHKFKSIGNC